MKRVLLMCLLAAVPLAAQEEKKDEPRPTVKENPNPVVQKLYILKYAEPRALSDLLNVFNVGIRVNGELHALAVSAPKAMIPAIDEAIAKLDVPTATPRNIELTCYLVVGGDGEAGTIPKELEGVVAQLKNTFPFKNYRLMDVLNLRVRGGQRVSTSSSGGVIPIKADQIPIVTSLAISSASVASDGTTIRIDGLRTSSKIPVPNGTGFSWQDIGVSTDVDIKEGQKVVIGRLSISHDQAMFLVMMGKVVS